MVLAAVGLAGYSLWSGEGALMAFLDPPSESSSATATPAAQPDAAAKPLAIASLNPLNGLTAEQFDEILARPLFNPTRRPAPPPPEAQPEPQPVATEEPPPEEPAANPDDFALLGVAAKDGTWTVVMRWNPTNEVFRLKTGGEIQGWTVATIAPQGVTVTRNDQSLDIKMFLQKGPPPAAATGEDGGDSSQAEEPAPGMDAQRAADDARRRAAQQQQQQQEQDQ